MKINEWVKNVHAVAKEKGWYEKERSALESHMLIVTELSEATECVRKNQPEIFSQKNNGTVVTNIEDIMSQSMKPEGEAVELVDAMIRIADYFGFKGWDLEKVLKLKMEYNRLRTHRHGGKKY